MSRTRQTDHEKPAVEWVACGWCGQPAGTWCTTRSGAWSQYLHGARSEPVWAGYRLGRDSAEKLFLDALLEIRRDIADEWTARWLERRIDRHEQETTPR